MRRTCFLTMFALLPATATAMDRASEVKELLKKAAQHRPGGRDFRWREIPWFDDPAAALKQARDEKRPLFVWIAGGRDRDGSPLERC